MNISLGYITQTLPGDAHEYIESKQVKTNEHSAYHLKLYNYAKGLGINVKDVFVYGSLCTSKLKHSYIFSSDGHLYKCSSMVGIESGRVDCWRSNFDCLKNYSTLNLKLYDFCFENRCPLIPLCHAECRFDALINLSDFDKVFCRRDSLLNLNKEMLKTNYLELIGGNE